MSDERNRQMTDDPLERVFDRYGVLGIFVLVIAVLALFSVWLFVVSVFPVALSVPVLIAAWMLWNVRGKKDE